MTSPNATKRLKTFFIIISNYKKKFNFKLQNVYPDLVGKQSTPV